MKFSPWFLTNWSLAGLVSAAILIAFFPLFYIALGPLFWAFLPLPLYMIHQYEEHGQGQFKAFTNRLFGKEVLTDLDILKVNVIEVWIFFALLIYLAKFVHPAFGLIPLYFIGVNGLLHVVMTFKQKNYNPGLWTSLALFLPATGAGLYFMQLTFAFDAFHHNLGLVAVLVIHLKLVLLIRSKLAHKVPNS